ncbi:AraC family transcriptional regulator [Sandaracinobacteroides sayramensis]|uniref:AraC family transcriptional regulator n=1 Tax=Sandaracinobacteroides sayramensis TaxID=2913411 RepID=UPI001EDC517B|nr:AraC family transcriptional regulator [Sandaracinobacteroides sayramensis]
MSERTAILRQRFRIGRMDFDYRAFPRQRAVALTSGDTMIHVVLPIAGSMLVPDGSGGNGRLGAGSALLLAAGSRTTCIWAAGSRALMLHIPRAAVQAEASRATGEPRRLAAIDHVFGWSAAQAGTALPRPAAVSRLEYSGLDDILLERRTLADLVSTLLEEPMAATLFPVARSVQRAVEQIRANPQHGWSAHDLVPVAGVTVGTLRRNFRTCLGVTITQHVQQIRLEWVRLRLESQTESRSISDLSLAAGFGASGMLNRAYQRHFGETPSQTRARAFRSRRG